METVVARCDQGSGNAAVPNGYRQEDAKASPEERREESEDANRVGIEISGRASWSSAPNSMQKSSFYAETRVEERDGGPTNELVNSRKIHRCLKRSLS